MVDDKKIEIIQGDTFSRSVRLKNCDLTTIEAIYFSCKRLGVVKQLTRNEDEFTLEIDCRETRNFDVMITNYDLTIKFVGDKVWTPVHCGQLVVLEKSNKVIV